MGHAIDWTGHKHELLTFIRPSDQRKHGRIVWEALCACGNTAYVVPEYKKDSCGCLYGTKDWTGKKYNYLTFVRLTDKRKSRSLLWELMCDCGTTCYKRACGVVSGRTATCGIKCPYFRAKCSAQGTKHRKYDPVITSARAIWASTYKDGDIDFDTFYHLSQQPCDYCGRLPYRTYNTCKAGEYGKFQRDHGDFTYNGLDRVDSAKGHTLDNVVPCCAECNWAKSKRTREQFLAHNKLVYEHTQRQSASSSSVDLLLPRM